MVKCEFCIYWLSRSEGYGECRRYAPYPSDSDYDTVWPTTHEEDFCGDGKTENSL